jgi:hypothetical protein
VARHDPATPGSRSDAAPVGKPGGNAFGVPRGTLLRSTSHYQLSYVGTVPNPNRWGPVSGLCSVALRGRKRVQIERRCPTIHICWGETGLPIR